MATTRWLYCCHCSDGLREHRLIHTTSSYTVWVCQDCDEPSKFWDESPPATGGDSEDEEYERGWSFFKWWT
jgi:hypothetical protein